ncbi:NAD-dependent deacetylase [Trypanosoma conorhini]|uniref:NAD-dependent protein deacylase n=1 Tax=Trypanosoma conorhini TaxID=83891 RepID=A0A422P9N4_9TRYP|nr:NAD-dependent deacetylase [Trypanosoma conorhini]RNF14408.1 NAD-dependent deacetylase [Trypanosoma conorhini]
MKSRCQWITILTGAGVSAESGLATFRDKDGLWEKHRVEEVACPYAFMRNPLLVQRFYNERRRALLSPAVTPNPAHMALARLQREHRGGRVVIVTQNVDNLHERAGSTSVLHMHGELLKVSCVATGEVFDWTQDVVHGTTRCSCCNAVETLRPHIVWFGETPLHLDEINTLMKATDLFVAIGTSGNVYPAAGFVLQARENGAKTLELNLAPGENVSDFDESIYGKASVIVPEWVERMLQTGA